jgi:hypothetical protein
MKKALLLVSFAVVWLYVALIYTPVTLLWVLFSLPLTGDIEESMEIAKEELGLGDVVNWKEIKKTINKIMNED